MKNIGKIAGYNIAFIFGYDIILRLITSPGNVMGLSTILVIGQVIANILIALYFFASKKSDIANSFMLTTFLVLIIGFGVCMSNLK